MKRTTLLPELSGLPADVMPEAKAATGSILRKPAPLAATSHQPVRRPQRAFRHDYSRLFTYLTHATSLAYQTWHEDFAVR